MTCPHCHAAPGEKCAKKRVHRKGWKPPCVIEREDRAEAEFAALWEEVMASRARRVEEARQEARRRRDCRDANEWAALAFIALSAASGLALCVRNGWLPAGF